MDDRDSISRQIDPRRRDEWKGITFLLGEVEALRGRGLILDEACRTIVGEYSARRDEIERVARFEAAIKAARDLAVISPRDSLAWAARARELGPDRPEGWIVGCDLLRRQRRYGEADQLAEEAERKFPELVRPTPQRFGPKAPTPVESLPTLAQLETSPSEPRISWSSVAGEILEEHWQKLISCLAVLLIVVSSTVGASLVLGPLLWSPAGKGILALVFTAMCAGFGVGLVRWGAERAGQVMLATTLIVIPINLMLAGELGLLIHPSAFEIGLVAVDSLLLFLLARWVVGALGIPSGGTFTAAFFAIAAFNTGASRGMSFEVGFVVFLTPAALFLGSVAWLNSRVKPGPGTEDEPPRLAHTYMEFGLLAFAFLSGLIRTGATVLQLVPALYAIPAMLLAIAGVSTARAIEPIEKDRRRILLFLQGGLALSAMAFALALASPPIRSALYSGNTLAVAVLGLALYSTSLRATRQPAYLYCGFAALFVGYFGAFYFAKDLVRAVEEVARQAMGYDRPLPAPFKAINGLVFTAGLALLSRFFALRWSDDRLARHCHYIGIPFSIAACLFSGFEPKAGLICLGGYAILYAVGTRMFAEPRLIYLACGAVAGSAYFGASLAGGATLGLRSMLASVLGLAFWAIRATPALKRAGESYRKPLIHAARAMAALAMAAASVASLQDGMISPLATYAFLLTATLALLNGHESPRASIYFLAIAALLGSWLGGYHFWNGGQPTTLMVYGLAVACFAPALLAVGEASRTWLEHSEAGGAYRAAMADAVPVIVFLAWALASWRLEDGIPVARSFLVGSSALLWLTRFRRESALVYVGLLGLATWVACLCGLVAPWDQPGQAIGWLAMTSAGCSLAYWGVGEWVRRRGDAFYNHPCFMVAGVLAGLASGLAIDARWLATDTYRLDVAAMLVGAVTFSLIAASRGWPSAVKLGLASVVGASSLAVLSQGLSTSDAAWWLGFVAVVESIACRGVGWLIWRFRGVSGSYLARPLDLGAFALMVAAIPSGYQSPTILCLLAVSSLLMIGSFPAAEWLYGTFLALGAAVYHAWLSGLSWSGLIPFAVLGAYFAWGVGAALQRYGPKFRIRFGLVGLLFERPTFRVSIALGAIALLIRLKTIVDAGGVWTTMPWLPWALALLCLLMLRFEPKGRGWVHAAAGFSGLGFTAVLAPVMEPATWWATALMSRTIFWMLAGRGAVRVEDSFRRRLGIARGFDAEVFTEWSLASFLLSAYAILGVVVVLTFLPTVAAISTAGWWDVLLGLTLAGLYVILEHRRFDRPGSLIRLEIVAVLAVWWLAVPGSFLTRLGIDRSSYLPLATAGLALGVVALGFATERRMAGGLGEDGEDQVPARSLWFHEFTSWFGFAMGLASFYFAAGATGRVAFATLLLTSGALGWLAVIWRRFESAIAGSVGWCLAWAVGFVLVGRTFGWVAISELATIASLGLTAALTSLWVFASWVRARSLCKSGEPVEDGRIATAIEWVAIAATLPSACLALVDLSGPTLVSSGVFLILAAFFAMVAWRKEAEWPVYLAQLLMLGSYFRARPAIGPSETVDVLILTSLCYLDLGLSELMSRLRLVGFARPTLRFAMALPLIPILQGIWGSRGDELDLFVLLATGVFYSLAGFRLRSKTPAYAAAVLFNAFLWLTWYRLGWRMADRPQFYLIPVGFSSILFAEVNRRELGRSMVNGARNLGLILIYASLAAPIWQTQDFGAWLALLLLSLVGIFVGIGLKVQSFLWLGLACFVADVTYQLGRLGMEHALARWGVMLSLGVALILFVALNEKKRIVASLREYYDQARSWD